MSETATATGLRSAPHSIPWSVVAGVQAWRLLLGSCLLAGGLLWLWCAGVDAAAVFAAPGPSAGGASAALPIGAAVLPGVACILWWLRAVVQLRVQLGGANVAPVELVFQQRLACSVPSRILCGYRFVDHEGIAREAQETVRAASPEGRCLWAGGRGLVAMFDPADPTQSHLVSEQRFADP